MTILAKDEEKQKAIKEKSLEDASSGQARVIGPSITSATVAKKNAAMGAGAAGQTAAGASILKTTSPPVSVSTTASASGTTKPSASAIGTTTTTVTVTASTSNSTTGSTKTVSTTSAIGGVGGGGGGGTGSGSSAQTTPAKKAPKMVLQPIPPFNANKARAGSTGPAASLGGSGLALTNSVSAVTEMAVDREREKEKEVGTSAAAAAAANAAPRLNINASSFKPTTAAPAPAVKPSVSFYVFMMREGWIDFILISGLDFVCCFVSESFGRSACFAMFLPEIY